MAISITIVIICSIRMMGTSYLNDGSVQYSRTPVHMTRLTPVVAGPIWGGDGGSHVHVRQYGSRQRQQHWDSISSHIVC